VQKLCAMKLCTSWCLKTEVTTPKHIKTTIFQAQHMFVIQAWWKNNTKWSVLCNTTLCSILDKVTVVCT
jgi:hypothetical protein